MRIYFFEVGANLKATCIWEIDVQKSNVDIFQSCKFEK